MNYPHPIIAREGRLFIVIALVVAVLVQVTAGLAWALLPWLVFAFIMQFFRDPPRLVPEDPTAVVSAADGRVVTVERGQDPYLNRESVKISVFMNVFNAHSNRSPVAGEVRNTWYYPGSFMHAQLSKASLANERSALWIRTPSGKDVTCVQVAGFVARRILCYAKTGQNLSRGERFGFIRFGSRVDLYLPIESVVRACVGDKVYATETVLAQLP